MKIIKKIPILCVFALFFTLFACKNESKPTTTEKAVAAVDTSGVADRKWWKEAVVYQLYPRSFKAG